MGDGEYLVNSPTKVNTANQPTARVLMNYFWGHPGQDPRSGSRLTKSREPFIWVWIALNCRRAVRAVELCFAAGVEPGRAARLTLSQEPTGAVRRALMSSYNDQGVLPGLFG